MLLEVNYSPDFTRISKFYPSFVREAFELLFPGDEPSAELQLVANDTLGAPSEVGTHTSVLWEPLVF